MPLVRRRHYSWPFSGPSTHPYTDAGIFKPKFSCQPGEAIENIHQIQNFVDDDFSAGIVASSPKNSCPSRLCRLTATIHSSRGSQHGRNLRWNREADAQREVVISTITQANNELPTAILRRVMRPWLEKARWHVFSHQHHQKDSALDNDSSTSISKIPLSSSPLEKKPVFVPVETSETSARACVENQSEKEEDRQSGNAASKPLGDSDHALNLTSPHTAGVNVQLHPPRHHRRCHSAQPRVWQEPSPGLWTLQEE
jgi:hypothetical protein